MLCRGGFCIASILTNILPLSLNCLQAVEVPPVTVPKFEKTKGKFEIPEFDVAAFNLTIAEVEQPAETAEKQEYSFKG
jgi:hypothetical protein